MSYFLKGFSVSFDPLSIFFLAVIALVAVPSAVYSVGYLAGQYAPRKIVLAWGLFIGFVGSMALVVTAANAFLFLVAWEAMSLISYFLVVFDTEDERSIRAGAIYIVMTHVGTAFIIAAIFIIYGHARSFDFAAMSTACRSMPAALRDLLFTFFLIGFGTKSGVVPLHLWLPYAHPQAPSHISSVMSGVMIKMAVYGFIRFVIGMLGVTTTWWGAAVLVIAGVSCFVGIVYAIMERDLKRLLAYSSVENMGIILLGIGAAMLFCAAGMALPALCALVAGLYHLVNHAVFKGLLFLGAGSVYRATGERNIEKLGGLIKRMPVTAATFLVGSLAISAIPPLNGFVSEWLLLQTFFAGAVIGPASLRVVMGILTALLALTGGLAAACFVKAFGITFLAVPRSAHAAEATESPAAMRAALIFLAAVAVVLGVAAGPVVRGITAVAAPALGMAGAHLPLRFGAFAVGDPVSGRALLSTPVAACALILALSMTAVITLVMGRKRVTAGRTWDCGYYHLTPRTEYTGTAFSKPFRIAFDFFLLPYRKTEKVRDSFYHIRSYRYELYTTPVFKRFIYEPALGLVMRLALILKRMQPGSIHLYLAYIFVTIVALIVFMQRF